MQIGWKADDLFCACLCMFVMDAFTLKLESSSRNANNAIRTYLMLLALSIDFCLLKQRRCEFGNLPAKDVVLLCFNLLPHIENLIITRNPHVPHIFELNFITTAEY